MDMNALIAAGAASPALLFIFALALGALHGLEPGHSKTMIAAYIVAIRGSVGQAALLGVSAAFSHSIIVWVLAAIALTYGRELIGEELEPILLAVSGVIIIAVGLWMAWRLYADRRRRHHHHHHHAHGDHDHHHHHDHHHDDPHAHLDAHAAAHAREIEARLSSDRTSTWQTVLFGLTGGLLPCPAAITVLLLCLQLQKIWLGVALVSAFSIGLALTLVAVGAVAAIGLKMARRRAPWVEGLLDKAPYASTVLILVIGVVMLFSGLGLFGGHAHA